MRQEIADFKIEPRGYLIGVKMYNWCMSLRACLWENHAKCDESKVLWLI